MLAWILQQSSTAFQSASRTCTASCTCVSLGMCCTCASKRASKDVQKFTAWWFQIQLFHPAARADILAPAQLTCNFYTPSSCTNHSISGVWDPRAMRSGGQNGCVAKLNFSYFFGFLGVNLVISCANRRKVYQGMFVFGTALGTYSNRFTTGAFRFEGEGGPAVNPGVANPGWLTTKEVSPNMNEIRSFHGGWWFQIHTGTLQPRQLA